MSAHEGLTLRKKDNGFGPLPKGSLFRAATYDLARAFRMLQREHPSENGMAWELDSNVEVPRG
jgi:hypothetical protein